MVTGTTAGVFDRQVGWQIDGHGVDNGGGPSADIDLGPQRHHVAGGAGGYDAGGERDRAGKPERAHAPKENAHG